MSGMAMATLVKGCQRQILLADLDFLIIQGNGGLGRTLLSGSGDVWCLNKVLYFFRDL